MINNSLVCGMPATQFIWTCLCHLRGDLICGSGMDEIFSKIDELWAATQRTNTEYSENGSEAAVELLAQLARRLATQLAESNAAKQAEVNPDSSLTSLCPSLQCLLETLVDENRELSGIDRDIVNSICLEIASNISIFLSKNCYQTLKISRTPKVMDRILLFDSESLEIRAHLFCAGAQETFVHNHGQSFISTCIEGSYVHKLWSVECDGGSDSDGSKTHYVHTRKPGTLCCWGAVAVLLSTFISNMCCDASLFSYVLSYGAYTLFTRSYID